MANPTSRTTLKDYCLRNLGYPVIQINCSSEQIEDRIDEGLQKFANHHYDGIQKHYLQHQVTQNDINNKYITVDDSVIYVKNLFQLSSQAKGMFTHQYNLEVATISNLTDFTNGGGLSNYMMTLQQYEMMKNILQPYKRIEFNRHMNKIYLYFDTVNQLVVGDYLIFEVGIALDSDTYTSVYNDEWLKRYITCLIKRQWGANLSKFATVQLVGGVQMRGGELYQEAKQELEELEQELELKYNLPPVFFVG